MTIKQVYSNKAKPEWKFDEKTKQFWSWSYDIRLENGRRKRESGFSSRQIAETAVARIRINEKEGKYNLQIRSFPYLSEICEKRLLRIDNKRERVRAARVLRDWLNLLPNDLKIDEFIPAHIRLYIDLRLKKVKASSVHREVTIIASALHSAYVDFPELENNWNCPRIPRPRVSKSRRERLITAEEIIKVLTSLPSPQNEGETTIGARNRAASDSFSGSRC